MSARYIIGVSGHLDFERSGQNIKLFKFDEPVYAYDYHDANIHEVIWRFTQVELYMTRYPGVNDDNVHLTIKGLYFSDGRYARRDWGGSEVLINMISLDKSIQANLGYYYATRNEPGREMFTKSADVVVPHGFFSGVNRVDWSMDGESDTN